jgi:hypothetical protein
MIRAEGDEVLAFVTLKMRELSPVKGGSHRVCGDSRSLLSGGAELRLLHCRGSFRCTGNWNSEYL